MSVLEMAILAKKATSMLRSVPEEQRLMALDSMASALDTHRQAILDENQKDLENARKNKLSSALMDRLILTEQSIASLSKMCRDVGEQQQVVGTIVEEYQRPN